MAGRGTSDMMIRMMLGMILISTTCFGGEYRNDLMIHRELYNTSFFARLGIFWNNGGGNLGMNFCFFCYCFHFEENFFHNFQWHLFWSFQLLFYQTVWTNYDWGIEHQEGYELMRFQRKYSMLRRQKELLFRLLILSNPSFAFGIFFLRFFQLLVLIYLLIDGSFGFGVSVSNWASTKPYGL